MTRITAEQLVEILRTVARRIDEAREHLADLDGAIGDADHGRTMSEGFAAVVRDAQDAAHAGAGAADLLPIAARSFLDAVGATAGPLYASGFQEAGRRLAGRAELSDGDLLTLVAGLGDGIARRGKAVPGDKTMMDAFGPALRAIAAAEASDADVGAALGLAARAAAEGRDATRTMVASKGRAARLGTRSLGHVDPGAASAAIVIDALREAFEAIRAARGGRG
ncbi:dihydroxyacetone kinase subunit DhaL [Aureimonas phyllosphaerae]|uniref:Dihydroxyacetone kinase-like protein n=1 Tax=Aureimonas phyllosphaerae TaxID=1166078 RepID=A0A7W6BQU7_9HYPH|nr:dihydroxyacetone kinase subunit DhaL [Aureimonas phyllosphaerae]MBB3936409.1 dihydroxyacetone kinase-like protein [Aureimonas phyllosphaerae]MBB3960727.1 dihydroxyacetone kinase-like protein [Aureimonas phyllosphaerae]SFF30826.1 dihydroxyacetone kinase DhaL subunit [Aureimonas phyllosphaerae]